MNYYDVLGVRKTASQEEIRKAYHSLVKQYHPDINKAENAAVFFNLIQDAYNKLGNEDSRKEYDSINNNDNSGYRRNKSYSSESAHRNYNNNSYSNYDAYSSYNAYRNNNEYKSNSSYNNKEYDEYRRSEQNNKKYNENEGNFYSDENRQSYDDYYGNQENSEQYEGESEYSSEENCQHDYQSVSDDYIRQDIHKSKGAGEILIKIAKILLKIILVLLLPILSFIGELLTWASSIIYFISRVIMLILITVFCMIIYDIKRGDNSEVKFLVGIVIALFVMYCLPYISLVIPIILGLIKDKINDFVFK